MKRENWKNKVVVYFFLGGGVCKAFKYMYVLRKNGTFLELITRKMFALPFFSCGLLL